MFVFVLVLCLELFKEAWREQHSGYRGGEHDQRRRESAPFCQSKGASLSLG